MEDICRTCMLNKAEHQDMEQDDGEIRMSSIFNVPEEDQQIKLNIKELIKITVPQLKIEDNDMLPKHICQKCLEKITDIYQFQQKCLNIEEKLYKILNESDLIDPVNNTEPLEIEIVKTEMLNDDNSMEYTCNSNEMMEKEEININYDPILNDCNESDFEDMQR